MKYLFTVSLVLAGLAGGNIVALAVTALILAALSVRRTF